YPGTSSTPPGHRTVHREVLPGVGSDEHQHLFQPRDVDCGNDLRHLKHAVALSLNGGDSPNHQTGWINPIRAGGDDQVPLFEVLGSKGVFQTKQLIAASPTGGCPRPWAPPPAGRLVVWGGNQPPLRIAAAP